MRATIVLGTERLRVGRPLDEVIAARRIKPPATGRKSCEHRCRNSGDPNLRIRLWRPGDPALPEMRMQCEIPGRESDPGVSMPAAGVVNTLWLRNV